MASTYIDNSCMNRIYIRHIVTLLYKCKLNITNFNSLIHSLF